jgi:SAM-dependent methyltransferase
MSKLLNFLSRAAPSLKQKFLAKIQESVKNGIRNDPHLAAKFYPYAPESQSYLLAPTDKLKIGADLPVPPRELWWGYSQTPEQYLEMGKKFVDAMQAILRPNGGTLEPGQRILDFGCASGIMIRWLRDLAEAGEVWGVDISERHTYWCQQHLSPPFYFSTSTSFPHLPFEDGFFDFIYAGSVFTHIADLSEMWLLELKRITRPGGRLYLTIHDEHTVDLILNEQSVENSFRDQLIATDRELHFRAHGFSMFTVNRTPGAGVAGEAQVFHHSDYIRRHWGRYLHILSLTPEAYGKQTAVLLQKQPAKSSSN